MSLQFAFRLGTLTFATTLIRSAMNRIDLISGLEDAMVLAVVFFGIGFAIGEISRHIVQELVEQELASTSTDQPTGDSESDTQDPPAATQQEAA